MELELKPDFDEAVARLEAWWHCDVIDRACVQFRVPRPGPLPPLPQKEHASLRDRWMDVEYNVERAAISLSYNLYVAESFPSYMPNLGPDVCSTLFGGELNFMPSTSWVHPFVDDWNDVDFTPNFDNVYWQTIRKMTALSLEVGKGKYITAITDLHVNGDLLSAMRGREQLCWDLADRPDVIRDAMVKIGATYPAIYDDLYEMIRACGLGSTTWMSIYHDGRCYGPNCDFAGLISPEMFREFILPVLVDEMRFLDRSCYHLDGPSALPDLDLLLEVPELNGIQWVYGAGNGPATRWLDVYRRIQDAGKCAQVLVGSVAEIETILDELPADGLLFTGGGVRSLEEAEDVLKMVARKSRPKPPAYRATRDAGSPPA